LRSAGEGGAGAARDVGDLGGGRPAEAIAVELALGGEGDMVDVEVEAHADGIGGDEIVDVAGLVELHLGVARARAQGPEHDRRPALLPADEFGDRIDLLGRKGDDGRAARQARDLLLAGVGELRQARPGDDVGAGQQLLDERAHRGRTDDQRLGAAALVEQPVGEDVAALEVAGKLDLVDGTEIHVEIARHGLHSRHPVAGAWRLDLFLTRDEGHLVDAGTLDEAAIDLPRQEAQRQADDAALVRQHALDGEMRLARIGGSEDGGNAPGAHGRRQRSKQHAIPTTTNNPASRSLTPVPSCTTVARLPARFLTMRTFRERNAPESLTHTESGFVRYDIWWSPRPSTTMVADTPSPRQDEGPGMVNAPDPARTERR